jgi:hypothetical protein
VLRISTRAGGIPGQVLDPRPEMQPGGTGPHAGAQDERAGTGVGDGRNIPVSTSRGLRHQGKDVQVEFGARHLELRGDVQGEIGTAELSGHDDMQAGHVDVFAGESEGEVALPNPWAGISPRRTLGPPPGFGGSASKSRRRMSDSQRMGQLPGPTAGSVILGGRCRGRPRRAASG